MSAPKVASFFVLADRARKTANRAMQRANKAMRLS
jgi:hypothetical protein